MPSTITNYPALKEGEVNAAVKGFQDALHRGIHTWNVKHPKRDPVPHENKRNGGYGFYTVRDAARFKRLYVSPKGPVSGKEFGAEPGEWRELLPFLSNWDKQLISAYVLQQEREEAALREAVKKVAGAALAAGTAITLYNRGGLIYHQIRPYPRSLDLDVIRYRLDCSSFVTLCYWGAGLPDPNGRNYDGYGYTGTLWPRGYSVGTAKPGDLVFYGNMGAEYGYAPSHVAIAVSSTRIISFGSTPIKNLPIGYRAIRGIRRYV